MTEKTEVIEILARQIEQQSLAGNYFNVKILEQFAFLVEANSISAARSVFNSATSLLNLWQNEKVKEWFKSEGYFIQ